MIYKLKETAEKSFFAELDEMPIKTEIEENKLGNKIAYCTTKNHDTYSASFNKHNKISKRKYRRSWYQVYNAYEASL